MEKQHRFSSECLCFYYLVFHLSLCASNSVHKTQIKPSTGVLNSDVGSQFTQGSSRFRKPVYVSPKLEIDKAYSAITPSDIKSSPDRKHWTNRPTRSENQVRPLLVRARLGTRSRPIGGNSLKISSAAAPVWNPQARIIPREHIKKFELQDEEGTKIKAHFTGTYSVKLGKNIGPRDTALHTHASNAELQDYREKDITQSPLNFRNLTSYAKHQKAINPYDTNHKSNAHFNWQNIMNQERGCNGGLCNSYHFQERGHIRANNPHFVTKAKDVRSRPRRAASPPMNHRVSQNSRARSKGDAIIGALFPLHYAPDLKTAYSRQCDKIWEQYGIQRVEILIMTIKRINNPASTSGGIGGPVACESALRSAGTFLSRVRAPPSALRPDGGP
ncbi:metabotropic glutamate receptor [Plakobranchus ocellatus]|uniref:Metabotropic glutamate receptor n=1 Tax=Plakobranchus ocellatus TaxID=259542 RepID=A0AAV3ZGI5_9GAST|nr:metabotropic glutamate receptor [Plakobranchus ocellatus]